MLRGLYIISLIAGLFGSSVAAQNAEFRTWLAEDIWPRAQAEGVSRSTFDAALSNVQLNTNLPGLSAQNAPSSQQSQAEFRHPRGYFAPSGLNSATRIGRQLFDQYDTTLTRVENQTGVPGQILLAIWGRESSFGRASIPHDAFEILSTMGFKSRRAAYFTDELVAALKIVEGGFANREQMRSSWAGALGQPQFMPSNYLRYAVDGDGDARADIWNSQADTLASIGSYLRAHGWQANRDWGFEVRVPTSVSCTFEGPDNRRAISDWEAMGIVRVNGRDFPAHERAQSGSLLMPAGRNGPAFIVTPNFYVLKEYNESDVYALFVGHVADRIAYGSPDFSASWANGDAIAASSILAAQVALERQGLDVGGADGLVGFKTRRAIGQWQEAQGRVATCYPDQSTINAIAN